MPSNPPPVSGDEDDYLRAECDHLLQTSGHDSDSEHDQPADSAGFLGGEESGEADDELLQPSRLTLSDAALESRRRKAFFVRTLALLCACSLSVGSH
jgi:hypothetical protein